MKLVRRSGRVAVFLYLATAIPVGASGQESTPVLSGGPLEGPPVLDAPFSADALTTVRQTLSDGTRIERTASARYYRDRAGRIRIEQMIMGLEALNPAADGQIRTTIYPDPSKGTVYTLDPMTRTAAEGSRDMAGMTVGGGDTFSAPVGGARFLIFSRLERLRQRPWFRGNAIEEQSLGSRRIAGIETVGRRATMTIPVGQVGNDRPMEVVDERWESPELKMVIYSRVSDPRTGIVEYQLSNIRRTEPPPALFKVPVDYTIAPPTGDTGWTMLEFADKPPDGKRVSGGGRR